MEVIFKYKTKYTLLPFYHCTNIVNMNSFYHFLYQLYLLFERKQNRTLLYFCFNTIICLPLILFNCTFSEMEESKKTAAVVLHREQICIHYILQTINQVIHGHVQFYWILNIFLAALTFCLMNLFILTDTAVETMNGF